jgi:hypothetical protein
VVAEVALAVVGVVPVGEEEVVPLHRHRRLLRQHQHQRRRHHRLQQEEWVVWVAPVVVEVAPVVAEVAPVVAEVVRAVVVVRLHRQHRHPLHRRGNHLRRPHHLQAEEVGEAAVAWAVAPVVVEAWAVAQVGEAARLLHQHRRPRHHRGNHLRHPHHHLLVAVEEVAVAWAAAQVVVEA